MMGSIGFSRVRTAELLTLSRPEQSKFHRAMSDSSQILFETALRDVPPPLRTTVENAWQALIPSLPALREAAPDREWLSALARVFATSDFAARSCVQQPA